MKRVQKILAIIGVVVLVGLYLATLLLAIFGSEKTMVMFRVAFGCSFLLPFLLYIYIAAYKWTHRDENPWIQPGDADPEDKTDKP